MRLYLLSFLSFIIFVAACEKFEYSPAEVRLDSDEKNITQKNLDKLRRKTPSDTLKLVLFGDTQRYYDESVLFVKGANKINGVDFSIHTGDITDFGYNQEFKWMNDILSDLKEPHFTVIGNHDFIANGEEVYREMYGLFDYSFVYGKFKFIFLNTNSREFSFNGNVPNLSWLEQEIRQIDNVEKIILVSHVPEHSEDFDGGLSNSFFRILESSQVPVLTINGHHHDFNHGNLGGNTDIEFINTFSVSKQKLVVLETTVDSSWYSIQSF